MTQVQTATAAPTASPALSSLSSIPDGDLFSHRQQNHQPTNHHDRATRLISAAAQLLPVLCRGQALEAKILRSAMVAAFGGSDAQGAWQWKDVYEVQELAGLMFVRKYRDALARREPLAALATLEKLQSLMATQTRRSDISQRWQQFSTPLPMGFVVAQAAALGAGDVVLEPSAGTGLLALFAEGRDLHLNELEPQRRALLQQTFPHVTVSDHNGEYIDDLLPRGFLPSVVVMNPPFSTSPTMTRTSPSVAGRHVFSALNRLAQGGRLVAITGRNFAPDSAKWRDAFMRLQGIGRIVFSAALSGRLYTKHGTGVETRLTVIDKRPADDPKDFSGYVPETVNTTADLLRLVNRLVPDRLPVDVSGVTVLADKKGPSASHHAAIKTAAKEPVTAKGESEQPLIDITDGLPLTFETLDWQAPNEELQDCLYEPYAPQSVQIEGATGHPTALVQSAAMASVAPPKPTYIPDLPKRLITDGILSDAQLESVIYAGEAHGTILPGEWAVNQHHDLAGESEVESGDIRMVQFRQGWFLGDGTGCGKGRQVAGIILDNHLKGRKRALWISKNDKLLEDARRDWAALGGDPKQIVPLSKFKQGEPIQLSDGIQAHRLQIARDHLHRRHPARLHGLDEAGTSGERRVLAPEAQSFGIGEIAHISRAGGGDVADSCHRQSALQAQSRLPLFRRGLHPAFAFSRMARLGSSAPVSQFSAQRACSFSPAPFAAAMYSAIFLYRVLISGSLIFLPIMMTAQSALIFDFSSAWVSVILLANPSGSRSVPSSRASLNKLPRRARSALIFERSRTACALPGCGRRRPVTTRRILGQHGRDIAFADPSLAL